MAVSDDEIKAYVAANINDPAAIASAAQQYGVSAADLSRATGYDSGQVNSYFSNAGVSPWETSAPVVSAPLSTAAQTSTTAAPTSVEGLYGSVLGRASDPGGLAYWSNMFGPTIEPEEIETFRSVAAPELASKATSTAAPSALPAAVTPPPPPSPIQTAVDKWATDNPNATPQQLATAVKAAGGLTPELANVLATKYGTTADEINAGYNRLTQQPAAPVVDFQTQIANSNPDAYNQIKNLSAFTANENFGGKVQDYQVQLFTPLDTTKIGVPKQLEFEPIKTEIVGLGQDGEQQIQTGGGLKSAGVTPIGGEETESGRNPITGYESTTPVNINGVPVFARYDAAGQLTGYVGDRRVTTWLDGKNRVVGNWDAEGNPNPSTMTSSGGGFIKGLGNDVAGFTQSLGPLWTAAKIAFPELNLVDAGVDVARSEVGLDTAVKGALGYAGMQNSAATDLTNHNSVNATSGVDIGSGVSPAVQMTQNAQYAKLGAAGVTAGVAADKGNYGPLLALTANVSGINKMPEVALAANTLSAANAIATKDTAGLLSAAGNLTGSKDLKLAGAATNLINASNSGNQAALAVAGMQFASAINANAPSAASTLKTTIFGPTKIDTSGLQQGSPINPSGPSTNTSDAGPLGGINLASADGSAPQIDIGGAPIFAGTARAANVSEPVGYRLMTMDEADARPAGSYYDITQNAWFAPDEGGMDEIRNLRDSLTGTTPDGYGTDVTHLENSTNSGNLPGGGSTTTTGPLSDDIPTIEVVGERPVTEIPEIVITGDRPVVNDAGEIVITGDRPVTEPPVITPPPVVTPPPPKVVTPPSTPINPTPTKTTTASPLSAAAQTIPKLDSSPQGLTSTMQKNKKILRDLTMLFGTLTPELVSALEDRGIRVPEVPKENTEDKQEEPDLEKQIAEDRALETKFAAAGGEIVSKIDPKISYTPAGLLPAAQVIEQPSRLGALRHLRDSISHRPAGGLAQGGLPKKYVEATPEGHKPEFITGLTGYYASGAGTGQSDDIDAMLHDGDYVADADLVAALGDGSSKAGAEALEKFRRSVPHQENAQGGSVVPAKIADGEYVFPASFVTAIGQGDNKAGAKILDKMREAIRAHKRSAPTTKIPPKAKSPLDYLKMVKG